MSIWPPIPYRKYLQQAIDGLFAEDTQSWPHAFSRLNSISCPSDQHLCRAREKPQASQRAADHK